MNNFPLKSKEFPYYQSIYNSLVAYEENNQKLLGIIQEDRREVLCCQIVESLRRTRYIRKIADRKPSQLRIDPTNPNFDPERAAIFYKYSGNLEESFWLIFIAVHFGKNKKNGWRTAKEFYTGGTSTTTWDYIKHNFEEFENWYITNWKNLDWGFGNHRKYETLNPSSRSGTLSVIRSYIDFVQGFGSHASLMDTIVQDSQHNHDPFSVAYSYLSHVKRFGRLAKFDFISLINNIGLMKIEAKEMYVNGATGPRRGANLLIKDHINSEISKKEIDDIASAICNYLKIGMQPLEDALCNWQKSPSIFKSFRG